jgi:ribosome biogenesis GTPase / thiamine phosphate phosphatase
MEGIVRYGINNRYLVTTPEDDYECTLKGKKLKTAEVEYAALAPGDRVEFQVVSELHHHGVITEALPRTSSIARWNTKRGRVQVFAANIDLVVCVASTEHPDFKPRFVDRVLVTAEWYGVEPIVVVNKIDFGMSGETKFYLKWLEAIGYRVMTCSAVRGTRVGRLAAAISGLKTVLVGHSGVGKTSLVNRLVPGADLEIGEISAKYGKGVHTTRFARLIDLPKGGWIVDVPGIREIEPVPEIGNSLSTLFREFAPYAASCSLPRCTHTHEPGCGVVDAVRSGNLPDFRYESYCLLHESLR